MSLIAHYPLTGHLNDISGNEQHLTDVGGYTFVDGKIGQAVRKLNSYFRTGLTDVPQSLSITMWVKHIGTDWLSESLFGSRSSSNGFMLYRNDGDVDGYYRAYFWYVNTSGAAALYRAYPGISGVPSDEWFHVTMTRHSDGRFNLYKNGINIYSNVAPSDFVTWHNSGLDLMISASNGSYSAGDYNLNDVRIYNHMLSTQEVKEIAKAKVLHYTFNDFQEPTTNLSFKSDEFISGGIDNADGAWYYSKASIESSDNPAPTNNLNNAYELNFGDLSYDMYRRFNGLIVGATYTISMYVKLGTTTNFCMTVNNTSSWNTVQGQEFTAVNGLNTSSYTRVHITFVCPSTGQVNIHLGGHSESMTQQTIGTVFLSSSQMEVKLYPTPYIRTDGLTALSRPGTVHDISGYSNDAVLAESTTPEWVSDSKLGSGGYKFAIDSDIPPPLSIIPNNTEQITVAFWAYAYAIQTNTVIWFDIGGNRIVNIHLLYSNGLTYFDCGYTDTFDRISTANPTSINEWHHWAFTKDTTTGLMKMYLDGQVIVTGTSKFRTLPAATSGHIGGSFTGLLDDLRIYTIPLSDDDILELYQTRAKLDDTGNLFVNELETNGFQPSIIDYSTWQIGATSAIGWGRNGLASETIILTKQNPVGELDVIWATEGNDAASGGDGGWNSSGFTIDNTKTYRFTCWIRRENAGTGDGTTYYGTHGYGTVNGLASVGGAATYTNPYFRTDGSGLTNDSEWMLWVAYIIPTGSSSEPPEITDTKGIWDVSGVRTSSSCTTFQWLPESTSANFRSYLYYSIKEDERMYWYRPRVDIINGNEPTIVELVNCSTHRPLINESEEFVYDFKSIGSDGIGKFDQFSEVGITDGLVGYWKLNGDAKDYSGNNYNGTIVGATVTSGPKDLAYNFDGIDDEIQVPSISAIGTSSFTFNMWAYFEEGLAATRDILFGNYSASPAINLERDTNRKLRLYWNGSSTYSPINILPTQEWCMITYVIDRENDKILMYVNGIEVVNISKVLTDITLPSNTFRIGRDTRTGATSLKGKITDTRIYNRVISPAEVEILYKFGKPGTGMQLSDNGTLYTNNKLNEGL